MLSLLTITNFGLIDTLEAEFCRGLNVFTGETGAGKSILIDAMRVALGGRMNSSLVRDGSKPSSVEAVFDLSKNSEVCSLPSFSEFLQEEDKTLIIRRSFLPDGRGKIAVNGLSVTLSQLKELGERLMDIAGPHDHQTLFAENSHIGMLDRLSDITGEKRVYDEAFAGFSSLEKELAQLRELSSSRERDLDHLSSAIKELEQVPLDRTSYEKVLEESSRVANSEKLYQKAREVLDILGGEDTGISALSQKAFSRMRSVMEVDPSTGKLSSELEGIQSSCDFVVSELSDYLENLSFSPAEAAEINRKYDIYYDILRKYGPSVESAKDFYLSAKKKFELLSDMDSSSRELSRKMAASEKALRKAAEALSEVRIKTAKTLKHIIEKELKDLGIPHVKFECRVDKAPFSSTGADKVTFFISPNAGEELKPLADIVSSGEAARVMLALKKALTKADPVPCLVFDEIDSQIGGRLGTVTGKKLKELSSSRQVILITHLPQIASFGDRHIKVSKTVSGGRTSVSVSALSPEERTKELAKMMSGEKESVIAVTHAKNMLENAKK